MTVRFALLGAGRIGQVHAKTIFANKRAELVVVQDAYPPAAEAISKEYGCKISTLNEIEADPGIDAVVICTPTDTHADLIELFARAGKAIFCEKPIDLDIARVIACLDVVKQCDAKLMVGFNRRFDDHMASVQAAVAAGKVGDVESVTLISRDPGAPPAEYIKKSGGIFKDMTIHDFDLARFVLGEEPDTVFATGAVLTDPEIGKLGDFDSITVVLTTPKGKQCTISNSRRAAYGYDQRLEVFGSKGSASIENQRPTSLEIATAEGFNRVPLEDFFMERYGQAYASEIECFVDVVQNNTAPSPNGEDGLASLILAEAAVLSVKEKRAVNVSEVAVRV